MFARALRKFADWALARNAPGAYRGESDKRWAYTIESGGDKYLTRIMLPWRVFGVRPYLHYFHRPDADRVPHNHPWHWASSLILTGSYDEERVDAEMFRRWCQALPSLEPHEVGTTRRVRWFNFLTKDDYHRVVKLHGEVWTLFITGPRLQDWGFLTSAGHVPWTEYLGVA